MGKGIFCIFSTIDFLELGKAYYLFRYKFKKTGAIHLNSLFWTSGKKSLTVANSEEINLDRRLQHDSIQLSGKTVYLNPFLYWRRFDSNTDRWLREPGQLREDQIRVNRLRFYPEIDWNYLEDEDKNIKDGAVEMFLKSLDLISTFHPELSSGQLLEVERKMAVTKKRAFEKWVEKSFRRRLNKELQEKQRLARERFFREWREWLSQETTHKALLPFVAICFLALFGGWSLGMSSNSCTPYFSSIEQNGMK